VSRADFDHACAHLAAAGCSLGVARYEHEIMGGWIIEARCPDGDWLLAFDGRDRAFVTQRRQTDGAWGETRVLGADGLEPSLARMVAPAPGT